MFAAKDRSLTYAGSLCEHYDVQFQSYVGQSLHRFAIPSNHRSQGCPPKLQSAYVHDSFELLSDLDHGYLLLLPGRKILG